MTVMFMTEAGRKTGDSKIDRLAAEYEDTYGMPLSDAQIERLSFLSATPEFGNYAIDTSGFVSDAPFGSAQRQSELDDFRNKLLAERNAKRANLTLETAGLLPDQPVFGGPVAPPAPGSRPRLPGVIDDTPIFAPPSQPPVMPSLPPIGGGSDGPTDYLNQPSPYAELGDYLLNRPVFDRGKRTDDPMSIFRERDRMSEGVAPPEPGRLPEMQTLLDRIADLEQRLADVQQGDALPQPDPARDLANKVMGIEQPTPAPTPAAVMANISDGRADELGLFDVGNEMGQGGIYDRMAPPNIEELRKLVEGRLSGMGQTQTPTPVPPPDPSRLEGMVMGVPKTEMEEIEKARDARGGFFGSSLPQETIDALRKRIEGARRQPTSTTRAPMQMPNQEDILRAVRNINI
tara:strand:+ start:251 stop:1459 length:1209 start_codon:yes stop_codon:yes gene_type:complete